MAAKVKAVLTSQRFSLEYVEGGETSIKIVDNWRRWAVFSQDSVTAMVANKSATVHVYSSDGDFNLPPIGATVSYKKHGGDTYILARAEKWNKADVEEVTSLMEFKLSALWIQFVPNQDPVDPVMFFQSADRIAVGKEPETNFQGLGCIADGKEIVWQNPDWPTVNDLLPHLKLMCATYELDWQLQDER